MSAVIPAKAGIQEETVGLHSDTLVPAFAGMTSAFAGMTERE